MILYANDRYSIFCVSSFVFRDSLRYIIIIILHIVTISSICISFVICQQCRKSVCETKNYHRKRYEQIFKIDQRNKLKWRSRKKKQEEKCWVSRAQTPHRTTTILPDIHLHWKIATFKLIRWFHVIWSIQCGISSFKPNRKPPSNVHTYTVHFVDISKRTCIHHALFVLS